MPNIAEDLQKIKNAVYGEEVRDSIHDAIRDINNVCDANVATVTDITNQAKSYRDTAIEKANEATAQAQEATRQKGLAEAQAQEAARQVGLAEAQVAEAVRQVGLATAQAQEAARQVGLAEDQVAEAERQVGLAEAQVAEATSQATTAGNYATSSASSASAANDSKTAAKTSETNAEIWYNKAKQVAETISGPTRLLGTIPFADLPDVSDSLVGDMWNISDAFTTTADFEEGAGHDYSAGCNVYLTDNNKWDVQVSDYGEVLTKIDDIVTGALITTAEFENI